MVPIKVFILFFSFIFFDAHGAQNSFLRPSAFPKTINDTTFVQRTKNAQSGYAPYQDLRAFDTITIESEEAYMLRNAEIQHSYDIQTMSTDEYCKKYPLDAERCPQTNGMYDEIVSIGNRHRKTDTKSDAQTIANMAVSHSTPQSTHQGNFVGYSEFNTPVYSDTRIYNGPCTLPQRNEIFTNEILTSGRFAQSDPAFEKTMITTFRAEGGCINDPDDSGGYTCYGISQNNNPEINVQNITRQDAEQIAHTKYYTQYGIDKLPDYIRSDVFTFGWGCGPVTGIHKLCQVLGLAKRNKIDQEIISAVENYPGDLHNDYIDALQQHYITAARKNNNQKYLNGWMHRVKLTRENSCHYPTTEPLYR